MKRQLRRAYHKAQAELTPGTKLADENGKVRATVICASSQAVLFISSDDLSGEHQWFIEDTPVMLDILASSKNSNEA